MRTQTCLAEPCVAHRLSGSFRCVRDLRLLPLRQRKPDKRRRVIRPLALGDGGPDVDPLIEECPVPKDQQPVQELKALQMETFFSWATLPFPDFLVRLFGVWVVFLAFIGFPVSAVTFDPAQEPIACALAASAGSLLIVIASVLRLYFGWSHVGGRLLSATVEYEETGWYDGQVWVKTPKMLTRDRLAGAYTVKPALSRLKTSLVALSGVAVTSFGLLMIVPSQPATVTANEVYYEQPPRQQQEDDYWERVRKFEPWALTDDERPQTLDFQHSLLAPALPKDS